jgi:hypothetical protein
LVDKKGKAIDGQATFRMRHFMGDEGKVFDLIVQRSVVTGQVELDLEACSKVCGNNLSCLGYMPHHWHIALIAFISLLGICFIGNDFTGINNQVSTELGHDTINNQVSTEWGHGLINNHVST